jgi:hypothetical protein
VPFKSNCSFFCSLCTYAFCVFKTHRVCEVGILLDVSPIPHICALCVPMLSVFSKLIGLVQWECVCPIAHNCTLCLCFLCYKTHSIVANMHNMFYLSLCSGCTVPFLVLSWF